jgi:hypothetical protein
MTDVSPEMPEMSLAEEIIYQNKGIQFLESIHAMANLDSEDDKECDPQLLESLMRKEIESLTRAHSELAQKVLELE